MIEMRQRKTGKKWGKEKQERNGVKNKAVYTTAPVAGSWGSNELGRGSNELGRSRNDLGRGINNHRILISELFYLQTTQKRQKSKEGRTDGRTDRPIDRQDDL